MNPGVPAATFSMNGFRTCKVLDVTLRDGGNQNHWRFAPATIRRVLEGLPRVGADCIEVGYVGGSGSAAVDRPGITFDCGPEFFETYGSLRRDVRWCVMVVPSVAKLAALTALAGAPLDLIRVAVYPDEFALCRPFVERVKALGWACSLNLMAASRPSRPRLEALAGECARLGCDAVCLADSFGHLAPAEVQDLVKIVSDAGVAEVGFHGHDNLSLAAGNAVAAIQAGARSLDAALGGLGRGAGNLRLEVLLAILEKCGGGRGYDVRGAARLAGAVAAPILRRAAKDSEREIACGLANLHYFQYPQVVAVAAEFGIDPLALARAAGRSEQVKLAADALTGLAREIADDA
jgi:4-hydroxy-2-oxovalerate aldolase